MNKHQLICALLFFFGTIFMAVGYSICISYTSVVWGVFDALFTTLSTNLHLTDLTPIMQTLSWWGMFGTIGIWTGLTILFGAKKNWKLVGLILVLSVGGFLIGDGIKELVHRGRPNIADSYGMPSNHMLTSIIIYMFLAYLTYTQAHRFGRSIGVFTLGLILAMAIGFSRIYLGVHFFSDVVAGYCLGLGYFLIVLASYRLKYR